MRRLLFLFVVAPAVELLLPIENGQHVGKVAMPIRRGPSAKLSVPLLSQSEVQDGVRCFGVGRVLVDKARTRQPRLTGGLVQQLL